jgi:hypothetical protein
MSIFSDQHIYVRTRANNHYLVTTELCENLERSYHRETAYIVPYGRAVCENDGSYLFYENHGRETTCPILSIERVESRSQAKEFADGSRPTIVVTDITPED